MTGLLSLIQNFALLSIAVSGAFIAFSRLGWPRDTIRRHVLKGLLFGAATMLVVELPVTGLFGATFDTRAAPLVLAAYIGGPVAGVVAATLGAIARWHMGGGAALGGVVGMYLYMAAGLAFAAAVRRFGRPQSNLVFYVLLALFATIVVLPSFFVGQSVQTGLTILAAYWPILLGANLGGIVFAGIALEDLNGLAEQRDAIARELDTSVLARRAALVGVWRYEVATDLLEWDEVEYEIMGVENTGAPLKYTDFEARLH